MTAKRYSAAKPTAGGRRQKLSVSIIGAGRMGTALAIALDRAGHRLGLIVAKRAASAKRAARLTGDQAVGLSAKQLSELAPKYRQILEQSALIVIATPDDAIGVAAEGLAVLLKSRKAQAAAPVVLHTSGALTSDVLAPLRKLKIPVGALHPLVSISDARGGADWLSQAFFSLEGDAAARRMGKQIVRDFGGQTFTIAAASKPLYHAAALMASPNLTALIDIALEMLSRCGLSANQSRRVLLPLLKSTIDNLTAADPARALTGTFKRGDVATVQKHVDAISSQQLADALEAYVLLGRRSMKLAQLKSVPKTGIEQILTRASRRAQNRR